MLFCLVGCQNRVEDQAFMRVWGSSKEVAPPPPRVEPVYIPEPQEPQIIEEQEVVQEAVAEEIPDRVFFGFDQYALTSTSSDFFDKYKKAWESAGYPQLIIDGHCDERGERVYNIGLGMRRASALKTAFVSAGIPENYISVRSFGKESPIAMGSHEEAWAQNRVAIIRVAQ